MIRVKRSRFYRHRARGVMVGKECENIELVSHNMNDVSNSNRSLKSLVLTGSNLILALEDMMEFLRTSNDSRDSFIRSNSKGNTKSISINEARDKTVKVKALFNDFQTTISTVKASGTSGLDLELNNFQSFGESSLDEILTGWIIRTDVDKAIDNVHNICYRVREIMRKIDKIQ